MFTNLRTHSTYTVGLGIGTAKNIISRAKELKVGLAITDYNTMSGIIDFYKTGKELEHPVCLGVELGYINTVGVLESIVLIARNFQGYGQLCKLTTLAHKNSLNDKPRINIEEIRYYARDLICVYRGVQTDVYTFAKEANQLRSIFGDYFYTELNVYEGTCTTQNKVVMAYALTTDCKYVITCDAYLVKENQKILQDIVASNAHRSSLPEKRYLMSEEEIIKTCVESHPYIPMHMIHNAFAYSYEAYLLCSTIELHFEPQIVEYPYILHPLYKDGMTKLALVFEIIKNYGRMDFSNPTYRERLQYELQTIIHNGKIDLIDYFLVLEDLCRWCRSNGISIGTGRGCLSGNSHVLTIGGYKMLKDIQIGDRVYSHTGKSHLVTKTYEYHINEEILELKTMFSLDNIILTKDHKVYGQKRILSNRYRDYQKRGLSSLKKISKWEKPSLQKEWIQAKDLNVGDLLFMPFPKRSIIDIPSYSEDFCYWLGYWIGNGWWRTRQTKKQSYTIGFAFHSEKIELMNKCINFWVSLGYRVGKIQKHKTKKVCQINIYGPKIWNLFYNIFPDYKKSALTKYIPLILKQLPDFKLMSLLRGYGDADGSNKEDRQSYDTSSRRLALDLKECLLYLKIPSSISVRKPYIRDMNNKEYMCQQSYKIRASLDNSKMFNRKIIITNEGYFTPIIQIINNNTTDRVYDLQIDGEHSYLTQNFCVHNSGAGSLLNYVFMVTHLDPIKHNLMFERFISSARIQKNTFPDVDLDFSCQELVRQYLIDTYGQEKVKQICAFQTIRLKNAVKDVFKALHPEIPFQFINNVTTNLPKQDQEEKEDVYYDRCMTEGVSFKELMDQYPDAHSAIKELIGFNRQFGIHAAGVAISKDDLDDIVPMHFFKDKWAIEYDKDDIEYCGILKYDILSLNTLTIIQKCVSEIKTRYGKEINIYEMSFDDKKVFQAFEKGDTESVFQFNSDIARTILTKISVESLDDLSLVTSVGRPGPMANKQHDEFVLRKNGKSNTTPPHPSLSEDLKSTYGIMIYQENVMKAAQILGGFSLVEADDIRKAMGKKKAELLASYKDRFLQHAVKTFSDLTQEKALHIWQLMETFSSYGFNAAHSKSYAALGYICQWFKVYYPLEWWFACLAEARSTENLQKYYMASSHLVKLPDINKSKLDFFIDDENKIQMPFSVINGVGNIAVKAIMEASPFLSFEDFFNRVKKSKVHKGIVEALIFGKAFSCFGDEAFLIKEYYRLRNEDLPEKYQNLNHIKKSEFISQYLDFIPLDYADLYSGQCYTRNIKRYSEMDKALDGENEYIVGKLVSIKQYEIKKGKNKGKPFYKITFTNCGENIIVTFWNDNYLMYRDQLEVDGVYYLQIRVGFFQDKLQGTALTLIRLRGENGT